MPDVQVPTLTGNTENNSHLVSLSFAMPRRRPALDHKHGYHCCYKPFADYNAMSACNTPRNKCCLQIETSSSKAAVRISESLVRRARL